MLLYIKSETFFRVTYTLKDQHNSQHNSVIVNTTVEITFLNNLLAEGDKFNISFR